MSTPTQPDRPSPTTGEHTWDRPRPDPSATQMQEVREGGRKGGKAPGWNSAPAWILALSMATIALCVLVLTVDLLYMQYLLNEAVEDLRREFRDLTEGLGGVLGGGAPMEPDGAPDCTDPFAPGC